MGGFMKYAQLKNLDRFDTYADLVGVYGRGRYGQFDATFKDYEMKEATPEIEAIITAFREKYEFVERDTEYIFTDDNDELGTGSSSTTYEYSEIGDACVFLLFENKVVGVAYPKHDDMPVVWFHENNPSYCLHDDIAFHVKSKK